MVLPVLLSVFSVHVLAATFPGPAMPSFNPSVLTQALDHICQAQAEGTEHWGSLDAWTCTAGSPHPGQTRWVQEETILHTQANAGKKNAYGFSGVVGEPAGNSASTIKLFVAQMMEAQSGNRWYGVLWLACAVIQNILGPSGAETRTTDAKPHLWVQRLCEVAGLVRMTQAIKQTRGPHWDCDNSWRDSGESERLELLQESGAGGALCSLQSAEDISSYLSLQC